MEYMFPVKDNLVYDIGEEEMLKFHKAGQREKRLGEKMTASSYRGEHFWDKGYHHQAAMDMEYLYRDPLTAGFRVEYPHGLIVQQSARTSYFRGERKVYGNCVPTLVRELESFHSQKEKELYRLVSDMRVAEFKMFLQSFEHVRNWNYGTVLYDHLAQHYGLETCWLDMTNDFDVALFFATCYYDDSKKAWFPLDKDRIEEDEKSRYGMIFHCPSDRANMRWSMSLKYFMGTSNEVIEYKADGSPYRYRGYEHPEYHGRIENLIYPIGFQPFMRCHMQSGYAIYMRETDPLENDWMFQRLRFRHSEELSKRVFDYMKGGETIYPHEGLQKAEFVVDMIKNATEFSARAFDEALYRNHYYRLADKEECLNDLSAFTYNGQHYHVTDKHPWRISSGRRKELDNLYDGFTIEENYNILVTERKRIPAGDNMFEPWMVMTEEYEPGVVDMHARKQSGCTDITTIDLMRNLHTLMFAKSPVY